MVAKLDTIYLPQYYDIIYRQYFALYLNISSGSVVGHIYKWHRCGRSNSALHYRFDQSEARWSMASVFTSLKMIFIPADTYYNELTKIGLTAS